MGCPALPEGRGGCIAVHVEHRFAQTLRETADLQLDCVNRLWVLNLGRECAGHIEHSGNSGCRL